MCYSGVIFLLLHAYLHHRVGYLHDVYLAGGYGELGSVVLGDLSCHQCAIGGVEVLNPHLLYGLLQISRNWGVG